MRFRLSSLLLLCLTAGGCASMTGYPQHPELQTCADLLDDFDAEVRRNAVFDAQDHRLPDFPYLRSDRFLAAYDPATLNGAALDQWLDLLRDKADRAWRLEWRRLPDESRQRLNAQHPFQLPQGMVTCADRLLAYDRQRADFLLRIGRQVRPPDEYITWWRIVGLYPLAAWIASSRYDDLVDELRHEFSRGLDESPDNTRRYTPPDSTLSDHEVADILRHARDNPLGIPLPDTDELRQLFARFAPDFVLGRRSSDDAIGTVTYTGERPEIDTDRPVVYTLPSYMTYDGDVLLQLNYIIWFPARTAQGRGDMYAGHLDGITWRVTLARDGRSMLFDTMHNCGCYHTWIAPPTMTLRNGVEQAEEPIVFHIDALPVRPTVKLAPATHYLRGIGTEPGGDRSQRYRMVDYDVLRALPGGDEGRAVSLFDPDGLVPSSRRAESLVLWPLGVPLPGGMRQWGHHAIVFVGRRHFDEPDLIERLFADHDRLRARIP